MLRELPVAEIKHSDVKIVVQRPVMAEPIEVVMRLEVVVL
jgi:hypothetical protein